MALKHCITWSWSYISKHIFVCNSRWVGYITGGDRGKLMAKVVKLRPIKTDSRLYLLVVDIGKLSQSVWLKIKKYWYECAYIFLFSQSLIFSKIKVWFISFRKETSWISQCTRCCGGYYEHRLTILSMAITHHKWSYYARTKTNVLRCFADNLNWWLDHMADRRTGVDDNIPTAVLAKDGSTIHLQINILNTTNCEYLNIFIRQDAFVFCIYDICFHR